MVEEVSGLQPEVNEVVEWDINSPELANYAPDIDVDDIPRQQRPAPVSDGYHRVRARLGNREGGPPVYVKGTKGPNGQMVDGKVVAIVDCRVINRETGQEGGFLKTWWPTTQVFKGQKGSQLTALCALAGDPVKSGSSLFAIAQHVEKVFAEAGEQGIELLVKTRWVKSVPKTDENGMPVYKEGTEYRDYEPSIYGEQKIKKLMAAQGIEESKAHIFYDASTGEERGVYAEVASLEDPANFEEV